MVLRLGKTVVISNSKDISLDLFVENKVTKNTYAIKTNDKEIRDVKKQRGVDIS